MLIKEVNPQFNIDQIAGQHLFNDLRVAAHWNALVQIIEVVVIVSQSNWQTPNDKSRQLSCLLTPLLFGIALDQLFIDIATDQRNSLFFQVLRLFAIHFSSLLIDLSHCFFRCSNSPHLIKGVHVEWQVVHFSFVVGHWRICVAVEFRKLINVFPDCLIRSMEDMGTVFMYLDAINLFSIDITSNMAAFFNYFNTFASFCGFVGKRSPKQARTYY